MRERLPRLGKDAGNELGGGVNGQQQAGIGPFAEPVVRPDHDVGALATFDRVEELVGGAVRMLHDHGNAGVLLEVLSDFSDSLVALVAIDPNQKFVGLPGQRHRCRAQKNGGTHQRYPKLGGSCIHVSRVAGYADGGKTRRTGNTPEDKNRERACQIDGDGCISGDSSSFGLGRKVRETSVDGDRAIIGVAGV